MTITTTFDPPLLSDGRETFDAKAFGLVADLNSFSAEANALAADVNAKQAAAAAAANAAALDAAAADTSEANAAASASAAAGSASAADAARVNAQAAAAAAATFDPALYVPKAGGVMTGPLSVPSLNGGHLAGLRNKIINGKMEIAQRGASFAAHVSGNYCIDRWWCVTDSVGVVNVSQIDIASAGIGFQKAIRVERTSGAARFVIGQNLETSEVIPMRGSKVTLSFWVRKGAALTSDLSVLLCTSTTEAKFGASVEFVLDSVPNASISTSLFTKHSFTLDIPAGSTAPGFYVQFQCDQAGAANVYFEITGVQLEVGSVATPFEHRPYGVELALCQRYYYRISPENTGASSGAHSGRSFSSTGAINEFVFPVQMRTNPTALEQSGVPSQYFVEYVVTGAACNSVPTISYATKRSAYLNFTVSGGLTPGHSVLARINGGYLGFSAEL